MLRVGTIKLHDSFPLSRRQIEDVQQNCGGFLFLTEVIEAAPLKYSKARHFFSKDDWFFEFHFPGQPLVPASILAEMMMQNAGVAICLAKGYERNIILLNEMISIKVKKPIPPETEVMVLSEIKRFGRGVGLAECHVSIDEDVCALGKFKFAVKGKIGER